MGRKSIWILSIISALVAGATAASAALPVNVAYTDPAGYGFYDPSLGVQRRAAFETALNTWTSQLQGTVPLEVQARFESMGGDAQSATLAYAGPFSVARDFPNAQPGIWYVTALGNQLAGYDLDPTAPDIEVVVNADVDNATVLGGVDYYYGLDGNAGQHIDFRTTIMHELGHGLGFISLIDSNTGEFFRAPNDPAPLPDIFSIKLAKSKKAFFSSKAKTMDRLKSKKRLKAMQSQKLRWIGPEVFATNGSMTSLYAPKPLHQGSSTSHWDSANYPDLLMEPFDTGPKFGIDLSKQALQDIGWRFAN